MAPLSRTALIFNNKMMAIFNHRVNKRLKVDRIHYASMHSFFKWKILQRQVSWIFSYLSYILSSQGGSGSCVDSFHTLSVPHITHKHTHTPYQQPSVRTHTDGCQNATICFQSRVHLTHRNNRIGQVNNESERNNNTRQSMAFFLLLALKIPSLICGGEKCCI